MTNQSEATRDMIQKQLKDLDQIFQETMETLNTVSGAERVAKWKTRTSALITESLGQKRGAKVFRLTTGTLIYQRSGRRVYRSHRLFQKPTHRFSEATSAYRSSPFQWDLTGVDPGSSDAEQTARSKFSH